MSVDIYSLSGEWEFSAEELLKRKNILDFNEEGTFYAEKVTKEKDTYSFLVWGTWRCGEQEDEGVLEVILDVQELPQLPQYPMTCLEKEKLPQKPEEMSAGEILSLPWSEYTICPIRYVQ